MDYNKYLKATVISSSIEIIITHPLDYIKTSIQKDKNAKIINLLRTPYKGLVPRLVGILPMRGLFWNSLEYFNRKKHSTINAGIFASLFQITIDYPIELVKIQKINNNYNTIQAFKNCNHICSFSTHLTRNVLFTCCINKTIQKDKNSLYYAAIGAGLGSLLSQPFDSLKTWYQSGNMKYPTNWTIHHYCRGFVYRTCISMIGVNVGWVIYNSFI